MDSFNILVMLKDGSFKEYEVTTNRHDVIYQVLEKDSLIATFKALEDGNWEVTSNPGNIDQDLIARISKQLTGYHT